MEEMKFCQSCGMPMTGDARYGSEADGSRSADYCSYCYDGGKFLADVTMEEMMDFCAGPMTQANPGMTREQAVEQMRRFFPSLKRWRR